MHSSTDDVIERLKLIFSVSKDHELADALAVHKTTLSSWRQRNSIPYATCIQIAHDKGVTLDWLLAGHGPMRREGLSEVAELDPERAAVLALYDALDPDQRREILQVATEKKRLNEVEATLQEVLKKLA